MHKVLIAHSSEDVRLTLEDIISSKYKTLTCADYWQALSNLHTERPDVLILDLSLHGGSAAALLQEAALFLPSVILATTWFPDDLALQSLPSLGIDFVLALPGKLGALIYRLEDILRQKDAQDADRVASVFHQLQIPSHLDGYKQLISAVAIYREDPMQALSKEIYPQIARDMGLGSWKSIDRSIRSAIKAGWLAGDPAVWQHYFPGRTKWPNAKLFISKMAEITGKDTIAK